MAQTTLEVISDISAVPASSWNACANPPGAPFHPFVSHAFLHALEASGSVSAQTGWAPQHILLRKGGKLCAAMPLYAKAHSQGEYVFDHGWADALMRAGGSYYPKLLCAVPFTPVAGPRFLVHADADAAQCQKALLGGALELRQRLDCSSLHINFLSDTACQQCGSCGLLTRTDQQFHWHNQSYTSFADFLDALTSRKRKTIRKERIIKDTLRVEWLTGEALTQAHWDAFFTFYQDTSNRKWGQPYLTREFFARIGESMAERVLLIMAFDDNRPIAGALNFIGGDALYGRNWGCIESHAFLHFELCYYQAIDYAIAHKLVRVEAGAQGPHKLARGYAPVTTYSAHYIAHEGLRAAVAQYLKHEQHDVEYAIQQLKNYTPYKQTPKKETTDGL